MSKVDIPPRKPWSWFTFFSKLLLLSIGVMLFFAYWHFSDLYALKKALATPAPIATAPPGQSPLVSEALPTQTESTLTPEEFAANIKLDISTKHQDALTRFSDLIFWYATFTTSLLTLALALFGAAIWKSNKEFIKIRKKTHKTLEELTDRISNFREDVDKKLEEVKVESKHVTEDLAFVNILVQYSQIIFNYYHTVRLSNPNIQDKAAASSNTPSLARVQQLLKMQAKLSDCCVEKNNFAQLLSQSIQNISLDTDDKALAIADQLYQLFKNLPNKLNHNYDEHQAKAKACFARFYAQRHQYIEAQEIIWSIKTNFKDQLGALAFAKAYLAEGHISEDNYKEALHLYNEIKNLGNPRASADAQIFLSKVIISKSRSSENPSHHASLMNQLYLDLVELSKEQDNLINLCDGIGRAFLLLILFYEKIDDPKKAYSAFYALKDLGGSEKVREWHAIASIILLESFYINQATKENIIEARAIFETLKDQPPSQKIQEYIAEAANLIIFAYGKIGYLHEARSLFDSILELNDSEAIRKEQGTAAMEMLFAYTQHTAEDTIKKAREVYDIIIRINNAERLRENQARSAKFLIYIYSKNASPENIIEARRIFDSMKDLGDTEEIRQTHAEAALPLVTMYCKDNKIDEACSILSSMMDLGETIEIEKIQISAFRKIIIEFTEANKTEKAKKMFEFMASRKKSDEFNNTTIDLGQLLIGEFMSKHRTQKHSQKNALEVYKIIENIEVQGEALEWKKQAEQVLKDKGWL